MLYAKASIQSCVTFFIISSLFYNLITECTSVGDGEVLQDGEHRDSIPLPRKILLTLQEVEKDMIRSGVISKSSTTDEKYSWTNNSRNSDILHISQITGFNSVVTVNRNGLVNYTQSKITSNASRVKRGIPELPPLRFPDVSTIKTYLENIPNFYENFLRSLRLLPFLSVVLDKKLGRLSGPTSARRISRNRQLDETYKDKQYCFGEIGCYTITKEFYHPVLRPLNVPPENREAVGTQFIFFTRDQPRGITINPRNLQAITTTNFDSIRPTKFVIHGWVNGGSTPWVQEMAQALLQHGNYNVIVVDWSRGAHLFYSFAASNAVVVALEVVHLLEWLQKHTGLSMSNVHLISESLGAQACGYVGQLIPGIGRITGLDPARPYFQGMPESVRLDPSDAIFVDVIHTNSHPDPYTGGFYAGSGDLSGHLDFFPNGGQSQPDCKITSVLTTGSHCSHSFAHALFTASLHRSCPFAAFPCKNYQDFKLGRCFSCDGPLGCAQLGINADVWQPMGRKQVAMYLTTTGQPDYCQYHYRLVLHLTEGRTPGAYVVGHIDVALRNRRGKSKLFRLTRRGAVRLALGTSPSFLLRHSGDHSAADAALVRWRPEGSVLRPCSGPCVSDLPISYVTLTPLDNTSVLTGNSSSVVMCDSSGRPSLTIGRGKTARFQSSHSCSQLHT